MMMKKFLIIIGIALMGVIVVSCGKTKRSPGRVYMPDMNYSRAYETYSTSEEEMKKKGIHYNALPVSGTIARGDEMPFPLEKDKSGDSVNYVASKQIKNPLSKDSIDMTEAARLYLVNCGICHGPKLDGQGPLFTSGAYPAAPKNFMDALMKMMPEGQMFYSVTYGKNMMGSYASQLSTQQRWMVIGYIKSKQESATPATKQAKPADSTAAKGK
jgi:mono/diheme cytochrome c family protein